jgi:hypothetical protein
MEEGGTLAENMKVTVMVKAKVHIDGACEETRMQTMNTDHEQVETGRLTSGRCSADRYAFVG